MRQLIAVILASSFLLSNVQHVDAAPTFSKTIHLDHESIASTVATYLADRQLFGVIGRSPVGAPPRPDIPTLPQVAGFHVGELRAVSAGPGVRVPVPLPPLPDLNKVLLPNAQRNRSVSLVPRRVVLNAPAVHAAQKSAPRTRSVVTGTPPTTGINHWWSYQQGAIPGVGSYMLNVGNGNLLVQSQDLQISERGVDLAFGRTYNSQSNHDYVGTDGSAPSLYGDGWTNSLDAHVASNDQGGYSIYDIDGARYDYNTPLGNGVWAPPTGQYAIFYIDPSNPNYVYWIKKDGTIYLFFMPNLPASIAGYDGKLLAIYGRNTNNNVVLNYSWDSGDASSPYKLAQIVVSHSDGQSITLQFGNVGPQRVLASLLRSDGAAVNYSYTIPGTNLVQLYAVYELPNNNTSIPQRYGWYGTGHQLNFAVSPRWNNSNALDGAYTSFTYANNEVNSITYVGYANPTPTDGTNTPMQQGFGASGPYRVTAFTYNSGNTVLSDRDGHGTSWTYDSLGRVTQTQEWNGSAWFTATQSWDNANNLLTTTDLRGNPTDYAYDNNGNTIAIAAPANNGFRATSYYSYDSHNNVTSYCDGVYSHAHSMDWMSRPAPSDTLCPSAPYTSRYTWDTSDTAEPFGKLTDTYTPMSYHTHLTYDPNSQGGDFGLATTIAGDGFSQLDGSTWTPKQILTYNSQGDPVTYDKGDGAWTLSYDTFNRLTMTVDPDNVHTYACYFYNGQIRAMTSAVQYALDSNTACSTHSALYSYDTDGDQTQDIRHYNNENSITDKWYDGDDRLIEVGMPQDGNDYNNKRDYYPWRWLTRYIYDLGQGNAQLFNSQISLYGHGNLIKTQEYTYNESQTWTPPSTAPQGTVHWQDIRGNSYDTLDRSTLKVSFVQGAIQQWSATYDVGYTGLLTKACDPLNNCSNASYTPLNQLLSVSFTGSATPSRTYSYDADGRVSSILSSTFGTEAYQYDYDGRMSMKTESGGGGFTSPATMTYSYYPNAARSALTLSSSAVSQTNLLVYNYRPDGALSSEKYNWTGRTNANINFSYTAAGRINARSDGEQGGSPNSYTYNYEFQGQPNATGRLSQLVIQQGTYAGFTYDAENENTAYTFTDHNNVTSNWSTSYNVRGEIVGQNLPNTSNTTYISANGYMIPSATPSQADGPPTTTFDTYMSALRERITSFTDDNGTTTFDLKVGFDAAGRQTSQTQSGSLSRTYDAENHVSSAAYTSWPIQGGTPRHPGGYWNKNFSYVWGATGHPATINGESLHWDGDTLLFVTNSTGQLDDLKLGVSADHTPLSNYSNVTFSDRDGGGSQVACHNTNGASAVVFPTALRQSPKPCYQDPAAPKFSMQDTSEATIGNGGILWSPGSDGYSDGDVIVQGARAYDVNLGTWTTPDDYPGDVNSPASQKPYEWNSNNSLSYADFSGYDDQNQPPDSQPPVTCTGGIAMVCVPEAFPPMCNLCEVWSHSINWNLTGVFGLYGGTGIVLVERMATWYALGVRPYAKAEGYVYGITLARARTCGTTIFSGGLGLSPVPFSGEVSGGLVVPNPGAVATDVMTNKSWNVTGVVPIFYGAGVGLEVSWNPSGWAAGLTAGSGGATVGPSWGVPVGRIQRC